MSRRRFASGDRDRRRWSRLRIQVFDAAGWRCASCGKAGRLECDHVEPISAGGAEWDPGNLQPLCVDCHIAKTRRERGGAAASPEVEAWRAYLART